MSPLPQSLLQVLLHLPDQYTLGYFWSGSFIFSFYIHFLNNLIQFQTINHLYVHESQFPLYSSDSSPKLLICTCNCPLDISIWITNRHSKLNMGNTQVLIFLPCSLSLTSSF